jgi:aminopeptidase N
MRFGAGPGVYFCVLGGTMKPTMLLRVISCVLCVTSALAALGAAPAPGPEEAARFAREFREAEARRVLARADVLRRAEAAGVQRSQPFDIQHWDLALSVDPAAQSISGTVTMTFEPTQSLSLIRMRLHPRMDSSRARLDGSSIAGSREGANLLYRPSSPLQPGTTHSLAVTYSGHPVVSGSLGGGMMFASHAGVPSATTLSEPFDSYAWWPCVDDVTDKATMEMHLTVPAGMTGASNGTLTGVRTNADGTLTYDWREDYPLSNYLISANVTNYRSFSDLYHGLDGLTEMPIDYYVYPEGLSSASVTVSRVPDMIGFFARLVGEYPFLREKYGMVAFPWGGGMEHQTLTSMGDAYLGGSVRDFDGIYAHELAHMWWGDEVTCKTWNDIWLNEGFATYFEALWLAQKYGMDEGQIMDQYYDDGLYAGALKGSVYRKSGNRPFADTGAVYDKGAWVLHMLKPVVGEGPFYRALRAYRAAHALGNGTTADLRAAFEAEYGHPLDWFFDQWVYTPFRPIYHLAFTLGSDHVTVTVQQRQKHAVARRSQGKDTYYAWLPLWFHYTDGTEEIRAVWNDHRSQTYTLPTAKAVGSVTLDDGHWILKTVQ